MIWFDLIRPVRLQACHLWHLLHVISCSVGSDRANFPPQLDSPFLTKKRPPSLHQNSKTMCPSIYNYLSLNDTKVFFVFFKIIHPSAQCWTLASAVCFNGRKLGMQNRPVVKGHVAPSASIQTMENLPVFSFCFLLTHSANKEALLWLTMSADAESSSLWMRSAWEHIFITWHRAAGTSILKNFLAEKAPYASTRNIQYGWEI